MPGPDAESKLNRDIN